MLSCQISPTVNIHKQSLVAWVVAKQLKIEFGLPSTLTTDYNIEYAVWMKQQYF